ncbi:hypothetical protein GCM10009092_13820 [Bowmanella denitrificans]|uniref:Uncharacterized protein n=1 Tax=Bowmanella denitrificans TaxID=366582 RepID=A0ABN0WYS8_9ALTE
MQDASAIPKHKKLIFKGILKSAWYLTGEIPGIGKMEIYEIGNGGNVTGTNEFVCTPSHKQLKVIAFATRIIRLKCLA